VRPVRPPLRALCVPSCAALATVAILAGAGTESPPADPAAAWVAFARSCFAGVETAAASVEHEVIHPLGAAQPVRHGVLRVRRGGLFRLEYGAPSPAVVVSDGRAIRAWDPASRIVVEEAAEGSALAAAFALALPTKGAATKPVRWLAGGTRPEDGAPAALAVELGRASPSSPRVAFALAPTCPSLSRIVIAERGRAAIRITLADVRTGVRLPAGTFAFPLPRGARVVRP
jgi:outer membrane lipoprotein-sorting protein